MVMWNEKLCEEFARAGFRVIRFDNRDVGLSSTSDGDYQLADMALDACQLVGFLGLDQVHVAGQSMGP